MITQSFKCKFSVSCLITRHAFIWITNERIHVFHPNYPNLQKVGNDIVTSIEGTGGTHVLHKFSRGTYQMPPPPRDFGIDWGKILLKRRKCGETAKGNFSMRTSTKFRLFRTFNGYSFNCNGGLCNHRTGFCPWQIRSLGGEQHLWFLQKWPLVISLHFSPF